MASETVPDPCPHLPLPDAPPDPDDPLAGVVDDVPGPGKVWTQFPWNSSFIEDPRWFDSVGRDFLVQKRIFTMSSKEDQVTETLRVVESFPDRGLYVMFKAAVRDKPHIIRALLDHGVKAHPILDEGDDDSLVPLHAAAFRGHLECVKILIEKGHVDPDICDVTSTPLQRAALAGHADIVKYLLDTGKVDVHREFVFDGRPRHPLEWITRSANSETANVLIDALLDGSDEVTVAMVPDLGISCAARSGHTDVVKRLLRLRGIISPDEKTATEFGAASVTADEEHEKVILEAIQSAALGAQFETLNFLLPLTTPLALAETLQTEQAKRSFDNGLFQAIQDESTPAFDLLASTLFGTDTESPEAKANLQSCFYQAAATGSVLMTKHILERYHVDVDAVESTADDLTPIAIACAHNKLQVVRYLLEEAPVRPDLTLSSGPSFAQPLWYAVTKKNPDVVRVLLRHGATIHFVPRQSPAEFASFFRIAACNDDDHQVRIYNSCDEWDAIPSGQVKAYLDIRDEDDNLKALLLDRYSTASST